MPLLGILFFGSNLLSSQWFSSLKHITDIKWSADSYWEVAKPQPLTLHLSVNNSVGTPFNLNMFFLQLNQNL